MANQIEVPPFCCVYRELIKPHADLLEMLAPQGASVCIGLGWQPGYGVITTSYGYTGARVRECEHAHVNGRECVHGGAAGGAGGERHIGLSGRGCQEIRHERQFLREGTGDAVNSGYQDRSETPNSRFINEGVRGFESRPMYQIIYLILKGQF